MQILKKCFLVILLVMVTIACSDKKKEVKKHPVGQKQTVNNVKGTSAKAVNKKTVTKKLSKKELKKLKREQRKREREAKRRKRELEQKTNS